MADNVRYCKFSISENAITDSGLWQQLWMVPYCRKEIFNVYMYSPGETALFVTAFIVFIMQWFPSVARLKTSLAELLKQLLYLKQTVFKGLKHAVGRWDKGRGINSNDSCSVRFNNCIFYS